MEDIAPELLERIRERFENAAKGDGTLLSFLRRAEQETATLGECGDYADRLGELLARVMAEVVTPEALPNGILYQNIAEKLLKPTLREVYERVNVSAARVQKAEDARRHIGLNAVKPDFPDERVRELSYVAVRPENTVEQALSYLQEPVRTISRSFFDDFVRENAKARWYAGMDPVVSREASPKCCEWCAALAGNWDYDDARTEGVFRRHQFCRCTVTYSCDGRAQDVWSKKFYDVDAETIRERAEYNRELIRSHAEENRRRGAAMALKNSHIQWPDPGDPIPAETVAELRQYASDKNITLRFFHLYDGDPEVIREFIDEIDTVAKDYPKVYAASKNGLQIICDPSIEPDDFSIIAGRTAIRINPAAFRSRDVFQRVYDENPGEFVPGSAVANLAHHEMGHIVCNTYQMPRKKAIEGVDMSKISGYAQKNFSEGIAEAFSDYYSGRRTAEALTVKRNYDRLIAESEGSS